MFGADPVVRDSVVHSSAIAHAEPQRPAAGHATADDKEDPSGFQCRWGRRQAEEGHLLGTTHMTARMRISASIAAFEEDTLRQLLQSARLISSVTTSGRG